jgi:hypothetical protein
VDEHEIQNNQNTSNAKCFGKLVKYPCIDIKPYKYVSRDYDEVALVAVSDNGRGCLYNLRFNNLKFLDRPDIN